MGGRKSSEDLRIPTPSGSALSCSQSIFEISQPHVFTFGQGLGMQPVILSRCQICEEDARKHSKGAPIGSRLSWQALKWPPTHTLPFVAFPAASCSLGRSAAQASRSRNLSKLDLCRGATAHTCQAVGAMLVAWRSTLHGREISVSRYLESKWPMCLIIAEQLEPESVSESQISSVRDMANSCPTSVAYCKLLFASGHSKCDNS
ncbi:hypothetical protein GGI43DRAFT_358794 [Trichoderma evansii]